MPNERATVVQTPAGADLTFTHLIGRDEVSRCFAYTVGFVSKNRDVDPLKMLGGAVSVEGESDPKRWFSGLVSDFKLTRIEDRLAFYEATVRPWLWFLGNTTDCRIFQNMTAVEIVEKIFSKYGIAKFEKRLQGSYPQREYCVQYDESDLDFVQRLLEHEGIFYFFEHDEGKHTLILCDAMSKLKPAPGYEKVLYNFEGQASRRDVEYITEWIPGSAVRPGAYAHTDYDFEKPGADLMAKSAQPFSHKEASGENYRQPGAHLDVGRGDKIAGIRREELQAVHQHSTAVGTVRGLFSGCKFTLESFPRDDQNQDYLVISAEYRLFDPGYRTQNEAHSENFKVVLGVAPTKLPYRPPRITPRPIMRGPQTATVVGPSGEEIFTDKYARVKVQFHWDRLGKKDQNSSCFVRVSQTWAGSNWGFIQIPRIGQEVIVDFIEGDPDLPIIIRPRLQRLADAALRTAGQRHAVRLEVQLLERRRRLQRADVRGQGGLRACQFPGPEGPPPADQARPQQDGPARPVRPHRPRRQALRRPQPRRGRRQQQDGQDRRRPDDEYRQQRY